MSNIEKFKDHFILFLEAGFMAVNQADEDSAIKLFKAAEILNPKSTLPRVGMGYLHLHKLEVKEACKIFEWVLQKEPTNEMARTLLGISHSFNPEEIAKGEKLLTEAAIKSTDPTVKTAANTAIAFIDSFVKKSPSPAEVRKPLKPGGG